MIKLQPSKVKEEVPILISSEKFLKRIYEHQNRIKSLIKCQICLKGTDSKKNHIVLCDFCNGAVHQKCYGVPIETSLPNGEII